MSFITFLFRILKSQYLLGMYPQLVILWSRHHPAQDANLNHKNYSRGWNYRHFCDLFRFFQGPLLFIICRIFLYNGCAMTWCWKIRLVQLQIKMYKDVPMSETATEDASDSGQRPSYSQRKLLRVIPEKHFPKCEERNYFTSLRPALVRLLAEEIN